MSEISPTFETLGYWVDFRSFDRGSELWYDAPAISGPLALLAEFRPQCLVRQLLDVPELSLIRNRADLTVSRAGWSISGCTREKRRALQHCGVSLEEETTDKQLNNNLNLKRNVRDIKEIKYDYNGKQCLLGYYTLCCASAGTSVIQSRSRNILLIVSRSLFFSSACGPVQTLPGKRSASLYQNKEEPTGLHFRCKPLNETRDRCGASLDVMFF